MMLLCELEPMEYADAIESALLEEFFEDDEVEDDLVDLDFDDDFDEVGFNPYMGCYDYDC